MTKDKKLDDNNIKDVSLLTPKTYDNQYWDYKMSAKRTYKLENKISDIL